MSAARTRIWIQGAGELASGVAWRLHRCGYAVACAEIAAPLAVRRLVCFSEAVYDGDCVVEGVAGKLVGPDEAGRDPARVDVLLDPAGEQLARWSPAAVIDGRMTKKRPEALPRGEALLIGLGPGFEAGRDADFVIETHRAARLGEVLDRGTAAADTGVPGPVGGQTSRRLVRAPAAGRLDAAVRIGDLVEEGQVLGTVAGVEVRSELTGRVRGLIRPDVELSPGMKVGDVDPRGAGIDPTRISDKALGIAGGVLEALLRKGISPGG